MITAIINYNNFRHSKKISVELDYLLSESVNFVKKFVKHSFWRKIISSVQQLWKPKPKRMVMTFFRPNYTSSWFWLDFHLPLLPTQNTISGTVTCFLQLQHRDKKGRGHGRGNWKALQIGWTNQKKKVAENCSFFVANLWNNDRRPSARPSLLFGNTVTVSAKWAVRESYHFPGEGQDVGRLFL